MTPQLLIIKIQSLINGSATLDVGQLKHLASQYQKLHSQCAKRLEQCVSLIKTNRDYLALDLVESEPPLLDTISIMSFPELAQWNSFCENNEIEQSPPFDEQHIELLQSLYTKDIGQTHPLYRDYRRAMRTHNTRVALKIIGIISKINSNNFDISQEYARLLNRDIKESLKKLEKALEDKDKEEALNLYAFLEAHKSDFKQKGETWEKIESAITEIKRDNAILEKDEILEDLKTLDADKDWALVYSKLEDLYFLEKEYSLSLTKEELDCVHNKQSVVSEKKKESDLEKLRKLSAEEVLAALKDEDKTLKIAARISIYKKLLRKKKLLDKTTLKKLKSRISSLRRIVFFKFLSKSVVLAAIVAASTYGGMEFKKNLDEKERVQLAAVRMEQILLNDSLSSLKDSFDVFKNDYSDLLSRYEVKLRQVESKIELQEKYKSIADSIFSKINANLDIDLTLNSISDINSDFASVEDIISNMLADDASMYRINIGNLKQQYGQKYLSLENSYKSSLREAMAKAELLLNDIDFSFDEESAKDIDGAKVSLDELKAVVASYSKIFEIHEIDKIKVDDLNSKYLELKSKVDNFLAVKKSLKEALNLNDYLYNLKSIQASTEISAQLRKSIATILSKERELRFGSEVKDFSEEELNYAKRSSAQGFSLLEKLPVEFLDVSNVYVYDNANADGLVYTDGLLNESRSSWTGGLEIVQRGKEYNNRGVSSYITKTKRVQVKKVTLDEIYKNGRLSKEAEFINLIQEEKYSLLKLINIIYSSDVDPMFKLWLESKIFDLAESEKADSGLLFSSVARDRAALVEKNSKGLTSMSWLRQDFAKKKELSYNLYSGTLNDLELNATNRLNEAKRVASKEAKLIAFADENGKPSIDIADFASAKIYAIDMAGAEVLIAEDGKILTKATPFSPLVIRD